MALTTVEALYSPEDDQGVIEQLQKYEDRALIVAGGTFLHGLISRGLLSGIEALIDLSKLGLNTIETGNGKIHPCQFKIGSQFHAGYQHHFQTRVLNFSKE